MRLTVRSRESIGVCGRAIGSDNLLEIKMEESKTDKPGEVHATVSDSKKVSMCVAESYSDAKTSPKSETNKVFRFIN